MFYKSALAATLLVVASPAAAQVTGGDLALSYAFPSDDENLSITEYSGGLEYAFGRDFAIAGNLKGFDFEDQGDAFANATIHFIYHLNEDTSFGAFYGRDAGEFDDLFDGGDSNDLYGIEAGMEFGPAEGEAYIGGLEDSDAFDSGILFGASGGYDLASGFSAIGSVDFVRSDDIDLTDVNAGIEYTIAGGPGIYGIIGQRSVDIDDGFDDFDEDSTYFEIGASISFGADRGTTFQERSIFNSFPIEN